MPRGVGVGRRSGATAPVAAIAVPDPPRRTVVAARWPVAARGLAGGRGRGRPPRAPSTPRSDAGSLARGVGRHGAVAGRRRDPRRGRSPKPRGRSSRRGPRSPRSPPDLGPPARTAAVASPVAVAEATARRSSRGGRGRQGLRLRRPRASGRRRPARSAGRPRSGRARRPCPGRPGCRGSGSRSRGRRARRRTPRGRCLQRLLDGLAGEFPVGTHVSVVSLVGPGGPVRGGGSVRSPAVGRLGPGIVPEVIGAGAPAGRRCCRRRAWRPGSAGCGPRRTPGFQPNSGNIPPQPTIRYCWTIEKIVRPIQ